MAWDKFIGKVLEHKLFSFLHPLLNTKSVSKKHANEIIGGSAIAIIYRIFGLGLGYLFIFLVSRFYGSEGVGIFSLTTSFVVILAMVSQLGFTSAILRFVGEYRAKKKTYLFKPLYKRIVAMSLTVAVLLAIALVFASSWIAVGFFKDAKLVIPFTIAAFALPLFTLHGLNLEFLRGLKKIVYSEYFRNVSIHLLNVLLLILLSIYIKNIYIPVACYLFSIFITTILSSGVLLRYFNKPKKNGLPSRKKLIGTSLPMMMASFSMLIMGKIDTIMLGYFTETSSVGVYFVAIKLATIISIFLMGINVIIGPKIAELFHRKRLNELKHIVKFSSKIMFYTGTPILTLFIIFPSQFLSLFGQEFIIAKNALIILSLGQFICTLSGSVGLILNMTGNQIVYRNIIISALALNILLNFTLIPIYGITGAAIATAVSQTLWNLGANIMIKKRFNFFSFPI